LTQCWIKTNIQKARESVGVRRFESVAFDRAPELVSFSQNFCLRPSTTYSNLST